MNHPKYRPDIDGLRAIAVLSVLGFHAFPAQFKAGFIGVDIFFVISGFLISSIIFENLNRGSFSFLEFYGRRIKRIFPALILVLLASFTVAWFALFADEFEQLGKHMAAGAAFVSNFALWQEAGYFDNAAETKPLLHLWSLAIEEQFYIFWPLLVWATWKRKWLFITTLITLLLVSFGVSTLMVRVDRAAAFFFPGSRIWELLIGVVLAYLTTQVENLTHHKFQLNHTHRQVLSTLGALLLAFAFYRIDKSRPYPGSWALFPVLGTFCLMAAGPRAWFNQHVLANRALVGIGLISYPLYLWHWPLLTFARIVESETPAVQFRIAALLLSAVLAWLTYRFLEKPIRSGNHQRITITTLCIAIAVLGTAGFVTYKQKGFPERAAAQTSSINTWDNLTFAQSCKFLTQSKEQDDWCNQGNAPTKAPTHVLLGDSVGNGFAPMLHAYATAQNTGTEPEFVFKQFGRGACPMLLGIGPAHCKELTQAAKSYIEHNNSIHTVLLAANWTLYFHGNEWYGHSKIDAQEFQNAFSNTVKHYQSLGKRVIVILAPPIGANPRACVVRPMRLSAENNCSLQLQDVLNNSRDYKKPFVALLAALHIDYFDPERYLCDTATCKVTDGPRILYLDHEHFSEFGGPYIANQASKELRQILNPVLN
ncbi:MAG TPA: acyltransferase family protein [Burkholderiaceae bacterium]|nr:acyltransferase family protein [Burkholderiaceae bacterium]